MKDKVLEKLLKAETRRQSQTLNLIASENFASVDVLKLLGSPLADKYSEGYPARRYYPGNFYYDQIEELAKTRALKTFGLSPKTWSVNVQPYSGSPANLAVYLALLEFGDTLMGMKLSAGGHLTHGHKVSFSGIAYKSVQYGVDEKTGLLDYNQIEKLAKKHRPKIIVSGLTAYPRKINFERFSQIAKSVGAYHLADISHIAGLVAAGLHPSPFGHADVVTTTTHKTLRGPRGAIIFSRKDVIAPGKRKFSRFTRLLAGSDTDKISRLPSADAKPISELIDRAVFPGLQGGPHNNVTAAIAEMFFEAGQPAFKSYQRQIIKNAQALAGGLIERGLKLLTDGTDNHLMLLDAASAGLDGMSAEKKLESSGIVANRNSLPGDPSPFRPSGLRLGTPALTSRGMREKEMEKIVELIYQTLVLDKNVSREVKTLCRQFPLKYKFN